MRSSSNSGLLGLSPGFATKLGALHFLVDAVTVSVVFRALLIHDLTPVHGFGLVLGYDLIAFGVQPLFGFLADRHRWERGAIQLGLVFAALSVLSVVVHPLLAMALAGLGNALFHMGAGACVLRESPTQAAPSGAFVAPGAIGLAFGLWFGKSGDLGSVWLLLPLAMLGWVLARRFLLSSPNSGVQETKEFRQDGLWLVLALLLASIAVRSWVGMGAAYECPKTLSLKLGIPAAAFAGKWLGGVLADRFGWREISVGALLLSLPLLVFGNRDPWVLIAGLGLFQMTMPVTLVAASMALPRRPATAFGLTTLALILGATPTFFPEVTFAYGRWTFGLLIALSAGALWFALQRLPGVYRPKFGFSVARSRATQGA